MPISRDRRRLAAELSSKALSRSQRRAAACPPPQPASHPGSYPYPRLSEQIGRTQPAKSFVSRSLSCARARACVRACVRVGARAHADIPLRHSAARESGGGGGRASRDDGRFPRPRGGAGGCPVGEGPGGGGRHRIAPPRVCGPARPRAFGIISSIPALSSQSPPDGWVSGPTRPSDLRRFIASEPRVTQPSGRAFRPGAQRGRASPRGRVDRPSRGCRRRGGGARRRSRRRGNYR